MSNNMLVRLWRNTKGFVFLRRLEHEKKSSQGNPFPFFSFVKLLTILLLLGNTFLIYSCNEPEVEIIIPPQQLPQEQDAIFTIIDGNWSGFSVFDLDSMFTLDTLYYSYHSPRSIEFSPDYGTWYTIHQTSPTELFLVALNAKSKAIIKELPVDNSFFVSDYQQKYIVAYYGPKIQIFNRLTFSLVHEDSLPYIFPMVASPTKMIVYGVSDSVKILSYSLDSFRVENITILDKVEKPSAIAITPDGRKLFVTVFSTLTGAGYFQVIDLMSNQIVDVERCGARAQMAVSLDGKYVYITDPAGYLYRFNPTGKLLRYNIQTKNMEEFIDWVPYNLTGGGHGKLLTDHIIVSPDNKFLYISTWGDGKTSEGKFIDILKIEIATKNILQILSLPVDSRGYRIGIIDDMKIGKMIDNVNNSNN